MLTKPTFKNKVYENLTYPILNLKFYLLFKYILGNLRDQRSGDEKFSHKLFRNKISGIKNRGPKKFSLPTALFSHSFDLSVSYQAKISYHCNYITQLVDQWDSLISFVLGWDLFFFFGFSSGLLLQLHLLLFLFHLSYLSSVLLILLALHV